MSKPPQGDIIFERFGTMFKARRRGCTYSVFVQTKDFNTARARLKDLPRAGSGPKYCDIRAEQQERRHDR